MLSPSDSCGFLKLSPARRGNSLCSQSPQKTRNAFASYKMALPRVCVVPNIISLNPRKQTVSPRISGRQKATHAIQSWSDTRIDIALPRHRSQFSSGRTSTQRSSHPRFSRTTLTPGGNAMVRVLISTKPLFSLTSPQRPRQLLPEN